jgi:hypothetical protein
MLAVLLISHPELFKDDCAFESPPPVLTLESCRTVESWFDIAKWLLMDALDATDECDFDAASSAACAAEFLHRTINEWTLATYAAQAAHLQFINAMARQKQRYIHVNSALRSLTFDTTLFTTEMRVVQSVRHCANSCSTSVALSPVTSLLVYSRTLGSADTLETTQLVWALAGVLSDLSTVLPYAPSNGCGLQRTPSNLPLFAPQRRVPRLGPQDWTTVRCDGAPRNITDLRIETACPMVLLFAALGPGDPETDELHSLAQLQLRDGFAPLQPLAAAQLVEQALTLRVATGSGGECHDYALLLATDVYESCALAPQPLAAVQETRVPLTLAPGESRCVGGTADGRRCEIASECGAGLACRRKPFDAGAYCYDGLTWHADRPCTLADHDDPCPYGVCSGAVNGFEGGLFPLLHFQQAASEHPAVASWHKYPNLIALLQKK